MITKNNNKNEDEDEEIESLNDELIQSFIRAFILTWFQPLVNPSSNNNSNNNTNHPHTSSNNKFIIQVRSILSNVISNLVETISSHDKDHHHVRLVTVELPRLINNHLRLISISKDYRARSSPKNDTELSSPGAPSKHEIESQRLYSSLRIFLTLKSHPALKLKTVKISNEGQKDDQKNDKVKEEVRDEELTRGSTDSIIKVSPTYLRLMIESVLKRLLPSEDFESEPERLIIREIVLNLVLRDVLYEFSKPLKIYSIILNLIPENNDGNSSGNSDGKDKTSQAENETDRAKVNNGNVQVQAIGLSLIKEVGVQTIDKTIRTFLRASGLLASIISLIYLPSPTSTSSKRKLQIKIENRNQDIEHNNNSSDDDWLGDHLVFDDIINLFSNLIKSSFDRVRFDYYLIQLIWLFKLFTRIFKNLILKIILNFFYSEIMIKSNLIITLKVLIESLNQSSNKTKREDEESDKKNFEKKSSRGNVSKPSDEKSEEEEEEELKRIKREIERRLVGRIPENILKFIRSSLLIRSNENHDDQDLKNYVKILNNSSKVEGKNNFDDEQHGLRKFEIKSDGTGSGRGDCGNKKVGSNQSAAQKKDGEDFDESLKSNKISGKGDGAEEFGGGNEEEEGLIFVKVLDSLIGHRDFNLILIFDLLELVLNHYLL